MEMLAEPIEKMTIKASSSLSMDAAGIIVTLARPDIVFRFHDSNGGCNYYKSIEDGEELLNFFENSSALQEVAKHVDDHCKVAAKGFRKICIDIPRWSFDSQNPDEHRIVSCEELAVHSDDEATIMYWMNRIDDGPKSLTIKPQMNLIFRKFNKPSHLSRKFAEMALFQSPNLKELVLMHWVPFSDDEFLNVRAPFFEIMSNTVSENAINQYLHLWVSGKLENSQRFGVSFDRPIEHQLVLRGLLVAPWDSTFLKSFPDIFYDRKSETRYTVFREIRKEEECSVGTLSFTSDNSWYFDVGKLSRTYEQAMNESQRERAHVAP